MCRPGNCCSREPLATRETASAAICLWHAAGPRPAADLGASDAVSSLSASRRSQGSRAHQFHGQAWLRTDKVAPQCGIKFDAECHTPRVTRRTPRAPVARGRASSPRVPAGFPPVDRPVRRGRAHVHTARTSRGCLISLMPRRVRRLSFRILQPSQSTMSGGGSQRRRESGFTHQ